MNDRKTRGKEIDKENRGDERNLRRDRTSKFGVKIHMRLLACEALPGESYSISNPLSILLLF